MRLQAEARAGSPGGGVRSRAGKGCRRPAAGPDGEASFRAGAFSRFARCGSLPPRCLRNTRRPNACRGGPRRFPERDRARECAREGSCRLRAGAAGRASERGSPKPSRPSCGRAPPPSPRLAAAPRAGREDLPGPLAGMPFSLWRASAREETREFLTRGRYYRERERCPTSRRLHIRFRRFPAGLPTMALP